MKRVLAVLPFAAVVTLATLAPPALPCSEGEQEGPDALMPGLDGADDVPTNARLVLLPPEQPWRAVVDVEGSDRGDEVEVAGDSVSFFEGAVELVPDTDYLVALVNVDDGVVEDEFDGGEGEGEGVGDFASSERRAIRFTTGGGADDEAPAAPVVTTTTSQSLPSVRFPGPCSSLDYFDGRTLVFANVALDGDAVAAVHFDGDVVDEVDRNGRFGFSSSEAGSEDHAFGVVDRAGNVSDPVVVTIDFGCGGGCAAASPASSSLAVALGVLFCLRARRRRPL